MKYCTAAEMQILNSKCKKTQVFGGTESKNHITIIICQNIHMDFFFTLLQP